MTDNSHIHPKLKVQRITPKSEFLKELDRKSDTAKVCNLLTKFQLNELLTFGHKLPDLWMPIIDVYTGSDLNHFRGSEWLNSESIPTYKSSK